MGDGDTMFLSVYSLQIVLVVPELKQLSVLCRIAFLIAENLSDEKEAHVVYIDTVMLIVN